MPKPPAEGQRPAPLGALAHRPGIDPMLVWAELTAFEFLKRPGDARPAVLPIVWEDRRDGAIRSQCVSEAELLTWLTSAADATAVRRLVLGLPVLPRRARPASRAVKSAPGPVPWPRSEGKVLLGVIDHGCPFAHALLRRPEGGTRVLALWDQDETSAAIAVTGAGTPAAFGPRRASPGYGVLAPRTALNALMQAHRGFVGIDESACYEAAGYTALRHIHTHGSGVLGVLVDRSRPNRPASIDPQQAPDLPSASADIVFVQIPRDSVQDSSSAALQRYVLDGIDAVIACAGDTTKHIVVTVCDGTSRTTHDGRSLVERGIAERVAQLAGRGVTLDVVVAAGNSRNELRHAQFDALRANKPQRVVMEVQPDDEAPTFVTLRLPLASRGLTVTVTGPCGPSGPSGPSGLSGPSGRSGPGGRTRLQAQPGQSAVWPPAGDGPPVAVLVLPAAPDDGQDAVQGLLALHPTRLGQGAVAPSGRWTLQVHSDQDLDEPVHLWISRSQPNATALSRGRQARFCDQDGRYDPGRPRRSMERDPHGAPAPIRRLGSLNGLATLMQQDGMTVVGAAFDRERQATPHTAAGPAAGGARQGPDYLMPVDFSRNEVGINAPGTRSGSRVRLSGSSFAAPQAAAAMANGIWPPTRRGGVPSTDPVDGDGVKRRPEAV